jgi:hypothetical protein
VSLHVPTLDDRTYADLVQEGIELLPRAAPDWTNHNASDPGITLLELFAYLTEIYLYRVDRVSTANKAKFFKLLVGVDETAKVGLDDEVGPESAPHVDAQLRHAIVGLHGLSRAVSAEDFAQLAKEAVRETGYDAKVAGVYSYPRRNFAATSAAERQRDRPGHISVVFVPADPRLNGAEIAAIARVIKDRLEPCRLITCRVHVMPPRYVDLGVRVRAAVAASGAAAVEQKIQKAIEDEYRWWPLGRSLFNAHLYRRLSSINTMLRVSEIEWTHVDSTRLLRSETGDVVGVRLDEGELPRVTVSDVIRDLHS